MKYIIGGGLSGLIAGYYNPEYTVLTYDTGGFIDTKYGRAFVVLHEDENMTELFDELGVDSFVKEIQIGYFDKGVYREPRGDDFARKYVQRKLPSDFQPGKDLELSAPGNSWRALFVDQSIVSALAHELDNIKYGAVREINPYSISFEPEAKPAKELEWESIVSTIPAGTLRKMLSIDTDWNLDHHPSTYYELEDIPERFKTRAWNILYSVDRSYPAHRIVRNMLSSNYYGEALGRKEDIDDTELDYVDSLTNSTGVIRDETLDVPFDGIELLGRYAQWQHDILINDVIERCKDGF